LEIRCFDRSFGHLFLPFLIWNQAFVQEASKQVLLFLAQASLHGQGLQMELDENDHGDASEDHGH